MAMCEIPIEVVVNVNQFNRKDGQVGQTVTCINPNSAYPFRYECCNVSSYDFKKNLVPGHKYLCEVQLYLRFETIRAYDGSLVRVNIPSYRLIKVLSEILD